MGLKLHYDHGQTPLNDDELSGLLIKTISTRGELDEFEQQNIESAIHWTLGKKMNAEKILTETFIKSLHKKMFGEVWSWAGKYRLTEKNIGMEFWQISTSLDMLLNDAKFWISYEIYLPDEIAIRFKHRLVNIHCFPNGNGRHSRLMADLIIEKIFKQPVFTWGANLKHDEVRKSYIKALREADKGDYEGLIRFGRE